MKSVTEKPTKTQAGESSSSGSSNSRYKGVRMRKWGKWVAEVRLPNSRQRIWLGSYDSPEKAARAYDAAVFCLRGPSATFNFPESPPDIPSAGTLTPEQIGKAARSFAQEMSESSGPAPSPHPVASAAEVLPAETALGVVADSGLRFFDAASPFDEFPAGWVFQGDEDDDMEEENAAGGAFYQPPRLWNF